MIASTVRQALHSHSSAAAVRQISGIATTRTTAAVSSICARALMARAGGNCSGAMQGCHGCESGACVVGCAFSSTRYRMFSAKTKDIDNDNDIHFGFEMRFPTHTFTDDEVAKIKSLAAERRSRPIDNDDDTHAGFEMRFPTHTFTPEEVAKIKSLAAERRKNITNDDDIHAGFEMRFPTHTYTDEEMETMKAEAEERKSKSKKKEGVVNDDDIHAGFEMRFPTHTYTEEEVHEMEADAAKRKTEKVLKDFFPEK